VSKATVYRLMGPPKKDVNIGKSSLTVRQPVDSEPENEVIDAEFEPKPVLDMLGRPVPPEYPHLCKIFAECGEKAQAVINAVNELNAVVKANINPKTKEDPFARFNYSNFNKHRLDILEQVKYARPWAVCPYGADGGIGGNCDTCHGLGYLIFMGCEAVPPEMWE